jgi:hypothetical protein
MTGFRDMQNQVADVLDGGVAFIVGATRWGPAWLQQCLDAYPDVCARGEAHLTDLLFPRMGEVISDYNAQADKIGNRLQVAGLPGNAAGLEVEDIDHLLRSAVGLMFRRWAEKSERPPVMVVEKTPEHVTSLDILHRIIPEARIIHVYRDGRDEAVAGWEFNLGLSKGEFPQAYPSFADYAEVFAGNWNRAIDAARRYQRLRQGNYLEVRVEDLVAHPHETARRVFQFLGIDIDSDWLRACLDTAWDVAPLDLEPGAWRQTFDADAQRLFNRQAGELLKLLGYETT